MAKWIEYLLKKKPADEDMLMLEDAETHNNKRVSFSGIADWLIEKMKKNNLISGALRFKGTAAYADLPGKGAAENDYYYCTDGDGTHGSGYYAWNGSSWIWIGNNDKGIDKSLKVEGAAAEAAATGEAIASLKEDMDSVAINGIYQHNYVLSWEQGKFKYESGLISYGTENYAIHSNFINISEINKPINIYVPDGIQIFALCFDNNNGTYTKVFPVCAWTPGKNTVTFTKTDILAKYIILMATRTSNGVIVPGDASGISVYISSSTKTQTDVDNLYASFLSHAKDIDDTNEKGTYMPDGYSVNKVS